MTNTLARAKPQDWYKVQSVGDDITFISEPHIKEFYRCNMWLVRGRDRDALIDSGMGVVSLRQWVPLVTERDMVAVASHTHFDHIGCHHEFENRIVHSLEADILANPDNQATLADPYATDDIFTQLPPAPYLSTSYQVGSAPATRLVEDGDIIDLGDRHLEIIHTPGHSPGGIALWEAATGILFAGDIVYDGPLVEETYHSNAKDYYASMVRLLDLPVRAVHAGHFQSYDGNRHKQIIRSWLEEKCPQGL